MKNNVLLINKDNTFLCSQLLLTSPIGLRPSAPAPRHAHKFPHFQLHLVYKAPVYSQIISLHSATTSSTPLKTCVNSLLPTTLDVPFPVHKSLSRSASKCTLTCSCSSPLHWMCHSQFASNLSQALTSVLLTFMGASKCHCNIYKSTRSPLWHISFHGAVLSLV